MARTKPFLILLVLIFAILACNAQLTRIRPTAMPTQVALVPTQSTEPVATQSSSVLPSTDAEVPRVPVDQAKAAFDNGEAIIVDVRSADAYAASHVKGAINIPLGDIETNPSGVKLNKNKWIITYCT